MDGTSRSTFPFEIVAFDDVTGQDVRRMDIDLSREGGFSLSDFELGRGLHNPPHLQLSDNGRRLWMFDENTVLEIDTARMQVVRTTRLENYPAYDSQRREGFFVPKQRGANAPMIIGPEDQSLVIYPVRQWDDDIVLVYDLETGHLLGDVSPFSHGVGVASATMQRAIIQMYWQENIGDFVRWIESFPEPSRRGWSPEDPLSGTVNVGNGREEVATVFLRRHPIGPFVRDNFPSLTVDYLALWNVPLDSGRPYLVSHRARELLQEIFQNKRGAERWREEHERRWNSYSQSPLLRYIYSIRRVPWNPYALLIEFGRESRSSSGPEKNDSYSVVVDLTPGL